ncbi:hypothetical protein BASA50_009960 [Batrachochytrium salamandrivorans]|uniref:Chitin synthase n=1 Tax=Batrachochytrium salamandrivorans TaxID=1357716 RepID=A0ABQ8F0W1_9FUNG|nr:hypothetical protein BASA50_009960 [Batrachochytrium salamandrivorans]
MVAISTSPVGKYLTQDCCQQFNVVGYTAATCDPDDFPKKYDLRPRRYNRQIKIALVVTMYNEDDGLFIKSLLAAQKNIAYLCSDQCPYSWGQDGWKNFVVCIVSDGRTKINPRVLTVLGAMGIYMDGLPRSSVNGEPVTGHIFEFTTQIAIDRDMAVRTRKMGIFPTQVIFVLKEKNAKKINSHKWFFNAVCEVIFPEVTMLLDVGTKPSAVSFYHLYRAFERDPRIGGACGEIAAELGPSCGNLLNPLVATQNFEYKMSNILDKPLESVFGYISVLPGAFSAYRYKALQGEPLYKYFLGEKPGADIFTSNLYLAEDRILCFELVTKKHEAWILKYVKSAVAETDVPSTLPSSSRSVGAGLTVPSLPRCTPFPTFRRSFSRHTRPSKSLFFRSSSSTMPSIWPLAGPRLPTSILLFTFCSKSPTLLTQFASLWHPL